MKKVFSVEEYIEINAHFKDEIITLREILHTTNLEETIKWSAPTYCLNGKNVLSLGAFKKHFCIWFFNGVFLKDEQNILEKVQEKTKGLRQLRFESISEINKSLVLAYTKEAIKNQELGKEIKPTRTTKKDIIIPELLSTEVKNNLKFKDAFQLLSPSCQREYCNYISDAKRETTKISRFEKIKPLILKGSGLHDKYKNC